VLQEHAVLDDNGDGQPTSTDAFKGLRAGTGADGALAREINFLTPAADRLSPEARQQRDKLELTIEALRKRKTELPEKEYYQLLETLMRDMAGIYGK
jgi:hypothetical protein